MARAPLTLTPTFTQRLDIDGSPVWINLNGEEHGASFTLLNPCDYKRELAAKLPGARSMSFTPSLTRCDLQSVLSRMT